MGKFRKFQPTPTNVVLKSSNRTDYIDYRDSEMLRKLMSPNGKILARKRSGLSAHQQRLVAQAIKRARYMALLPYTSATS